MKSAGRGESFTLEVPVPCDRQIAGTSIGHPNRTVLAIGLNYRWMGHLSRRWRVTFPQPGSTGLVYSAPEPIKGHRMTKFEQIIPDEFLADPLRRAKKLAAKMAHLAEHEHVSDVAVAVAMLTAVVIRRYSPDPAKANQLTSLIRRLEDQLLTANDSPSLPKLH